MSKLILSLFFTITLSASAQANPFWSPPGPDMALFLKSMQEMNATYLNSMLQLTREMKDMNAGYQSSMLLVSQDIGKMADRIGTMADRIVETQKHIGQMADRIVATEALMAQLTLMMAQITAGRQVDPRLNEDLQKTVKEMCQKPRN